MKTTMPASRGGSQRQPGPGVLPGSFSKALASPSPASNIPESLRRHKQLDLGGSSQKSTWNALRSQYQGRKSLEGLLLLITRASWTGRCPIQSLRGSNSFPVSDPRYEKPITSPSSQETSVWAGGG